MADRRASSAPARGAWLAATLAAAVAGCGRIQFDPTGLGADAAETDGAGADATGDASLAAANVVFVTRGTFTGDLGGLAGADSTCAQAAAAGGLAGTFVAWLSTTTVDAVDRLAGSRGWVRTDGVAALDTIEAALGGQMYVPIDRDEHGDRVPYGTMASSWTGSNGAGRVSNSLDTCGDWTLADTATNANSGEFNASGARFSSASPVPRCDASFPIVCFGVGKSSVVPPPSAPITGRIVFASTPVAVSSLAAFDQQCATDATAAGLSGTYRAAVATPTTTIASRFTLDGRSIQRVDGTLVASAASGLLGTTDPLAFINQTAAGGYVSAFVWTGADDPLSLGPESCSGWTDPVSPATVRVGRQSATLRALWGNRDASGYSSASCVGNALPVLCLQE